MVEVKTILPALQPALSVNWEYQAAAAALVHPSFWRMRQRQSSSKHVWKMAGKLPLSFPVPKGAFYAFMKIERPKWKKDVQFVRAALKEGVVFVPGSGFGRQETVV
jgi:aspartate/methionine/tyrosine aminotransferase